MKSKQERNFTTQDVRTISKCDITCFFCIASVVFKCVCVHLWDGDLYYAKVCSSPPCHILLWLRVAARWALPRTLLPEAPPQESQPLHGWHGTCTRLIRCCTPTTSARKIGQETELLFTCLKAATAATIKCCRRCNSRLFHGFPSQPGMD